MLLGQVIGPGYWAMFKCYSTHVTRFYLITNLSVSPTKFHMRSNLYELGLRPSIS